MAQRFCHSAAFIRGLRLEDAPAATITEAADPRPSTPIADYISLPWPKGLRELRQLANSARHGRLNPAATGRRTPALRCTTCRLGLEAILDLLDTTAELSERQRNSHAELL